MAKKFLFAITFISIAIFIGVAGYLFFAKQQPALAQTAGENIYISQLGAGSQDGSDCNNARPVSWFNIAGNWANPKQAGKIGPGDTAHLCGTISINLLIHGSGMPGNFITLLFESDTKLSKSHWNTSGSVSTLVDSAISGNGISYIIIDGGSNGLIEAINNGTNLTYQLWNGGFTCSNCSNIEVKNLSVLNMYQRVNGSDTNGSGGAVQFRNGANNIKIHNNTMRQVYAPVFIQASHALGDANIEIYNNTISDAGQGEIIIAADTINATLSNILIHDNYMDKGNLTWDGDPATHTNCIHIYAMATGTRIDGLKIYNNTFTGAWGNQSTSYVFIEGYTYSPLIYNNLFIGGVIGSGGNGYLFLKGSDGSVSANNTFVGYGTTGCCMGIFYGGFGAGDVNNKAYNNLFYNISLPIASPYDVMTLTDSDYNDFYSSEPGYPKFNFGSYAQRDFLNWKSYTGFDAHSTIDNPQISSDYKLTILTPSSVNDIGKNLSLYFTSDKINTPRPQGLAWDIGAYEYIQASPPLKGDFNSDSKVNNLDFTSFKNAFKSIFNSIFDLNSDSAIDVKDLGVLMSGWLP